MKTQEQIQNLLRAWETKHKSKIVDARQGSQDWFTLKLGVMSASNASKIVSKRDSATRETYMAELVGQIGTGYQKELDGIAALEWGKQHEEGARSAYEFSRGVHIAEVPFIFKDETFRLGVSPDGLVANGIVEIKCPFDTTNYIKFLCADKVKPEWRWQAQFQMFVAESEFVDFAQYDPRMKTLPIKIIRIAKNQKDQETIAKCVPEFIDDMDKMLKKAGLTFGDQWGRL